MPCLHVPGFCLPFWVAVVISPLAGPLFPPQPADAPSLLVGIGYEVTVGLFFALFAQVMLAGIQTAGSIIAYLSSMANAFTADPLSGAQSAVTGNLLMQVALVLLFATGMDHLMIQAVFESYNFVPARWCFARRGYERVFCQCAQ